MVPTIEGNHISETIKIQDNYGLDYSLEVLHTYNDDQTLFSIIINLVRHKRNKNVGQANLLFESNNDALIGDLIIYDYSSYLSINDKLYSLFNWVLPNLSCKKQKINGKINDSIKAEYRLKIL